MNIASQWTHLISGMTSVGVYHSCTTRSPELTSLLWHDITELSFCNDKIVWFKTRSRELASLLWHDITELSFCNDKIVWFKTRSQELTSLL